MEHALKFPDEATGRQLLGSALNANREDENSDTVLACFTHDYGLHIVGTILKDEAPLEGWHVNLIMVRDPLPAALAPYEVFPETPVVVWAK